MKKLLLTTAIAGFAFAATATPAAAEIQLGLGGHYSAYGIFADQDQDLGRSDFDLQREGEIYFTGETTLDNGLTVGVEVQLAASSNGNDSTLPGTGDTIDESYLYFSGNWGRVNVGSENGAAYLLQVGAPAVDANFDGIDPQYLVINGGANVAVPVGGVGYSYGMGLDNIARGDAEKLTYLSPVFSGFQVGASYSPNLNEDVGTRAGMPVNLGLEDEYQIGARWAGDFDGVGIVLGAGYATADGAVAAVADQDQWNAGAQVNIAGFTVGAAYFTHDLGAGVDRDTWTAGVNYGFGPYTVGASYLNTEVGTDEADRILVGGSYTYGPGLTFNGSVHFYNIDSPVAANENDATVVTLGTTVKF